MKTRVIGIGDNVCDKYYPAKIMYPGGQAMNFSIYAKMLGADAAYMGVFGRDEVADHVIRTLDELGVDHSRCRQYDGENGYAKVRLVDGDREFIMSNKGGIVNEHPLELTKEDLDYIRTESSISSGRREFPFPTICPAGGTRSIMLRPSVPRWISPLPPAATHRRKRSKSSARL